MDGIDIDDDCDIVSGGLCDGNSGCVDVNGEYSDRQMVVTSLP